MADAAAATTATRRSGMSQALVLLFAVSCGVSVANLYYAQPVLHDIAESFGTSSGTAGLVVTVAQIGYAVGLALLVPLGDLLTRRWLVPSVLVVTAVGLVISAAAPDIEVLIAVGLIVGAGSVAAQILVPMAASLADEEHRGHVVGVVMSGLLMGILLARTVSGVVAQASSWRVVYVMAACMTAVLAAVLAHWGGRAGSRATACSTPARVCWCRCASTDRFLATVKIHARCRSSGMPVSFSRCCHTRRKTSCIRSAADCGSPVRPVK